MGKRKDQDAKHQQILATTDTTDGGPTEKIASPAEAVGLVDTLQLAPPQNEPLAEPLIKLEAYPAAVDLDAPTELPKLEPTPFDKAAARDELPPIQAIEANALNAATAIKPSTRAKRWMPLAATIAVAAAVGGMAGSLVATGLARLAAETSSSAAAESRALRETIGRIGADIAALKASVDSTGRSTAVQFVRLSERFDHFERVQGDPAAKLAKIGESLDRIERRAPVASDTATTGSIGSTSSLPAQINRPPPAPIVDGWVVRNVFGGSAFIQGRLGILQVEPGDNIPGIGRIETIKRQDGRWVVVTSRGLITAR